MLPGIWMSVHISAMSDLDFEDGNGFIGIDGFKWHIAGVFHHIDRAHPQHHLILDDENDGWIA